MNALYKHSPEWVKDAMKYGYSLIPLNMRLGKRFYEQLNFLEKSQWWSTAELENYQNEELKKLIRHAYDNVPHYNKVFKANNIVPHDIKKIADLIKLPLLKKDDVRNNIQALRARNFKEKDIVMFSTSGTTGRPLHFYYEKKKDFPNFDPYVWRSFGWAGHTPHQRRATLSGWTTGKETIVYNPVWNMVILSAYRMSSERIEEYAAGLRKYKVEYLDAYPSAAELLTSYLKTKDIRRPVNMRAIFCHSEYLYDWQRSAIEDYWGCKCFNWYAMEERVISGMECEAHEMLHLCSDYGITEFHSTRSDGYGQIIATSLTNYAMPFIRYDTEDIGKPLDTPCRCGRGFPLFVLRGGRHRNFAIGKDGSQIPVTNIDIPNATKNVLQFQFIQEEIGALALSVIKKDDFGEEDLRAIRLKLDEKFGKNINTAIRFVDAIQQTNNRKTPIFIQNMKGSGGYGNAQ